MNFIAEEGDGNIQGGLKILDRKDKESHRDYAYRILRMNIMEFYMEPGCLIDESQLAEALNVSRMPIHEAVTKLKEERLIDVIPRKESKVSRINLAYANEGLFLRSTVEAAVLRLAINNASPDYLRRIWENLEQQKEVVSRENARHEFFQIDDEFHWMIYLAANKPVTLQIVKGAVAHLDRIRYLIRIVGAVDLESPSYQDHEKMYQMNKDKCCILEGLREPMFGLPSWLRRNQNFYMDLLANEELSDALHDKILAYYLKLIDFLMERIGDKVDVVKFADDMGTQNSLLLSPDTYRKRIKPYQEKLYQHVKKKYGKKILLHSCGSIEPIIGDLIEIGVDALNPVQISAANMEPGMLKARYGEKITFWGGGVDTQSVLNRGSVEDVRAQVEANLKTFKPGGGYVFAQVHNIQYGVPIDNILAMYETFHKYAGY
ncbi:MAG: FCD domain-containing protein [Lachnospiraceae bacterium]|nr:FCD domain-containing protein [Lachnospiraceae bacterium]